MNDCAVEMVRQIRATRAAGLPARAQHEVIDDQLALAAEQLGKRLLALRRIENVVLFHSLAWQFAAFAAERIAGAGKGFFFGEMGLARSDPFIVGNDFVRFHGASCYGAVRMLSMRTAQL